MRLKSSQLKDLIPEKSIEECIRISKESMYSELNDYVNYFISNIRRELETITEDELEERLIAMKYFAKIQVLTHGYTPNKVEMVGISDSGDLKYYMENLNLTIMNDKKFKNK